MRFIADSQFCDTIRIYFVAMRKLNVFLHYILCFPVYSDHICVIFIWSFHTKEEYLMVSSMNAEAFEYNVPIVLHYTTFLDHRWTVFYFF